MTEKLEIYKCNVCDNVVEICEEGAGKLVCCGEEMELMKENIPDESNAHYAIIENISETEKKITFNHPMTKEHYIEFVEVISKDKRHIKRKFFDYDNELEMTIKSDCPSLKDDNGNDGFYVRLYCNRDGVWTTEI